MASMKVMGRSRTLLRRMSKAYSMGRSQPLPAAMSTN